MRRVFKNSLLAVLLVLIAVAAVSCKKKQVNKIAVNNQIAISLFHDTITIREILGDMDSTATSWLRVNEDGTLSAYYSDSIMGAINAKDFLSDLPVVDINTTTGFTMPMFDPLNNHDTVIDSPRFMTFPFHYDGFEIENVVLRRGVLDFSFEVQPRIEVFKQMEIYSNQLISPSGEPLSIVVDSDNGHQHLDLSNYQIVPENDTVVMGARITIHVESGVYSGGYYECTMSGGLDNVMFKTVYAIVTKPLDSLFSDQVAIDYGINGLSGNIDVPSPNIGVTYRNTFGFGAVTDINTLEFYSGKTGQYTPLISDHINLNIEPTNGEYHKFNVTGFEPMLHFDDGYNRLDFAGGVTMALPGEHISISDTSTVDIIADVDLPLSFSITDLRYTDTVAISLGNDVNVQNYLDEIDFFIDYTNTVPVQVEMQGLFLRNNQVIDSLFDGGGTILYNQPGSLQCIITDQKMRNVMRANKMILRLGLTTDFDNSGPQTVVFKVTDGIAVRMKMLTKTSEINIDDVL